MIEETKMNEGLKTLWKEFVDKYTNPLNDMYLLNKEEGRYLHKDMLNFSMFESWAERLGYIAGSVILRGGSKCINYDTLKLKIPRVKRGYTIDVWVYSRDTPLLSISVGPSEWDKVCKAKKGKSKAFPIHVQEGLKGFGKLSYKVQEGHIDPVLSWTNFYSKIGLSCGSMQVTDIVQGGFYLKRDCCGVPRFMYAKDSVLQRHSILEGYRGKLCSECHLSKVKKLSQQITISNKEKKDFLKVNYFPTFSISQSTHTEINSHTRTREFKAKRRSK